jgi:hypothetical protein
MKYCRKSVVIYKLESEIYVQYSYMFIFLVIVQYNGSHYSADIDIEDYCEKLAALFFFLNVVMIC